MDPREETLSRRVLLKLLSMAGLEQVAVDPATAFYDPKESVETLIDAHSRAALAERDAMAESSEADEARVSELNLVGGLHGLVRPQLIAAEQHAEAKVRQAIAAGDEALFELLGYPARTRDAQLQKAVYLQLLLDEGEPFEREHLEALVRSLVTAYAEPGEITD